ncbi:hypothetical protein Vretifemale_17647, partial [Volvox reticuliferus]
SPEVCSSLATSAGCSYFGVQVASDCYCGNDVRWATSLGTSSSLCNMDCLGDPSQICGGPSAQNVYSLTSQYPVALVDGQNANEGRVEILYNSQWGTVCGNAMGASEATVICRQLGYNSGTIVEKWGGGSGSILMDNVQCGEDPPIGLEFASCAFDG